MITDENQYRVTRAALQKLREDLDLASQRERADDVDPRIHDAMLQGIRSQIAELEEQLRDYERSRDGQVRGGVAMTTSGMDTRMDNAGLHQEERRRDDRQ